MVLKLNAEPGIEQWWVTVTNLMHDHFNAERASLVVPRDSSDIENVSTILAYACHFSRFTRHSWRYVQFEKTLGVMDEWRSSCLSRCVVYTRLVQSVKRARSC